MPAHLLTRKTASDSPPTAIGTALMAGLGGPLGGGIYAGVKDDSFLTGLAALLAAGGAAVGGRRLFASGARGALSRFAPLVSKGLTSGEKLVTPGAQAWQRAVRFAPGVGAASGAIAGTAAVNTLASKQAALNISSTMPALFYALDRHHKIAAANQESNKHELLKALATVLGLGGAGAIGGRMIGGLAGKRIGGAAFNAGLSGGETYNPGSLFDALRSLGSYNAQTVGAQMGGRLGTYLGGAGGLGVGALAEKKAGVLSTLSRGTGQLARYGARSAPRMLKNVTPELALAGSAVSRGMLPAGRQIINMGAEAPGALSRLFSGAKNLARANPMTAGALAGGGAVTGYETLYGRPKTRLEGARLGAEGATNQIAMHMANAPLMQRLGFLFNPQGAASTMQQQALQQILSQLG